MINRQIGRNDPCHCGSGRKYKQCCLPKDEAAARQARVEADKTAGEAGAEAAPAVVPAPGPTARAMPPQGRTHQPWKRSATNTHGFQRMSSPRKVGGS